MKKSIKISLIVLSSLVALAIILALLLQPLWEFGKKMSYKGETNFEWKIPAFDKSKKTVLIMADNNGTEMFDMMAPYYLFNATGKANVYVVAQKKYPIVMKKGPFILPHFTYSEIDSLKIHSDVIVIPFMDEPDSEDKTKWIKKHFSDSTMILSICDGAWTAAATGLYDGKPLTAHASDFETIKKKFLKPDWINNVTVTQSGNLFSTAGVSNAAEGTLTVINELFGRETMLSVLKNINYPHAEIERQHKSNALNIGSYLSWLNKILFCENKNLVVLMQNGVSEFELAVVYDTYNRTMPSSWQPYIIDGTTVTSKYGLTLLANNNFSLSKIDEVHVLKPESFSSSDLIRFKNSEIVRYNKEDGIYIFNTCFERIGKQYGSSFKELVKLSLDFN